MKTKLKKNEEIILTVKKHWFSLIPPIFGSILIFLFGTMLIGIFSFIPAILWLIYKILERKSNIWIVTSLRVIDEYGVFSLNSKETPLDKINNVSYIKSFLGRIFGFGNVAIQSAAESGATTHMIVERPKILKDTITEYQEIYKENNLRLQSESFANISKNQNNVSNSNINEEIEKLHNLKEKGIITEQEFELGKNKILNN